MLDGGIWRPLRRRSKPGRAGEGQRDPRSGHYCSGMAVVGRTSGRHEMMFMTKGAAGGTFAVRTACDVAGHRRHGSRAGGEPPNAWQTVKFIGLQHVVDEEDTTTKEESRETDKTFGAP